MSILDPTYETENPVERWIKKNDTELWVLLSHLRLFFAQDDKSIIENWGGWASQLVNYQVIYKIVVHGLDKDPDSYSYNIRIPIEFTVTLNKDDNEDSIGAKIYNELCGLIKRKGWQTRIDINKTELDMTKVSRQQYYINSGEQFGYDYNS